MIVCKELDKSFATKEELFKALRVAKKDIIGIKKAQILKSIDKGVSITAKPLEANKLGLVDKNISLDDNHYYIAVNSTRVLDSHKDLHIDGLWNKTVKEQQGKNYLVDTHVMSLGTTIARKENIEIMTATVPFSAIGKSYSGDTEVLIYKVPKNKVINPIAKEWLESGDAIEGSVKMRYTDIDLAMNSNSIEDENELKNYNDYNTIIANKSDFEDEIDYFWIVKQAQNLHESSLVLIGSNNATGMLAENKQAEINSLEVNEPTEVTQEKQLVTLLTNIKL
jgi:hypothetical protein